MTRTGRPAKPTEQKRRQGTYRADRDPSAGNLAVVPAVAPELHELEPSEVMGRVLAEGVAWLAQTDGAMLALLREALEDYELLRTTPGVPPKEVREARKQAAEFLSQLGFDPTARARLGLAEVKAASVLEGLRAKRGN
jgi:hypothetical protein